MPEQTPGLVRCTRCGAGNPADAEWCGQCLTRFDAPDEPGPPIEADPALPEIKAAGGDPIWKCPACDADNPIDATACSRCGSSFTSFMAAAAATPETPVRPSRSAAVLSAVLPGLGHWKMRRTGAGVARGLLYVWSLGMALLLLLQPPAAARTLVRVVGAVFLVAAAGVWLVSMAETLRLLEGDEREVVPKHALTWVTAGLTALLFLGLLGSALAGRAQP